MQSINHYVHHNVAIDHVLADFRDNRERRRKNLEIVLNIPMGLVEAPLNPLEGDYVDVMFLPRKLVEDFNIVILHNANTKANSYSTACL